LNPLTSQGQFVFDSSIILAIFRQEQGATDFLQVLEAANQRFVSAATVVEIDVVLFRAFGRKRMEWAFWDRLLRHPRTRIVPFTTDLIELAMLGYTSFSAGRYGLNFGDCFSYATAKAFNLPLLFKGGDFGRTDLMSHPSSVLDLAP
jgi:ribonuclease VapC